MSWNPNINVVDGRAIIKNLLDYLSANQKEALLWANDGEKLTLIQDFFNSARIVTRFPTLQVISIEHATEFNDLLRIPFSVVFEVAIQHGKADILSSISRKYSMAIESLLANCTKTTFNQDSIMDYQVSIDVLKTEFDVLRKGNGGFIQIFQTQAVWELRATAFNQ